MIPPIKIHTNRHTNRHTIPLGQVDMSPVDWNASAIAGIALQHSGVLALPRSHAISAAPEKSRDSVVPVYTLDNGCSLPYKDLLISLAEIGRPIAVTKTYHDWLSLLRTALEEEDKETTTAEYLNPLRALRGALTVKPPKFGSTSCQIHMKLLEELGFPCPIVNRRYLTVYLQRFIDLGALPPPKV